MPSEEPALGVKLKRVAVHRQHCTLGPVPVGELNQLACAGAVSDCLRISVTSHLPCSRLAIASPPLLTAIVIIATTVPAQQGRGRRWRLPFGIVAVVIPIRTVATTNCHKR
jgi:hypothetical protein